jgi:hypothetical protein
MGCFILAVPKTGDYCLKMLQVRTREFRFVECCDATTVFKKSHAWDHSLPPTRSVADLSDVARDDEGDLLYLLDLLRKRSNQMYPHGSWLLILVMEWSRVE